MTNQAMGRLKHGFRQEKSAGPISLHDEETVWGCRGFAANGNLGFGIPPLVAAAPDT